MTRIWHVNNGDYKNLYLETIKTSKSYISEDVLKKISIPEAVSLPDEYVNIKHKILIMGQETLNANQTSLYQAVSRPYFAWQERMGGQLAFDYAFGGDGQADGPFWRAFEEVKTAFALPTRRAMAWSNLLKVQLMQKEKGSHSVVNLQGGCMPIVGWQRLLFQAELKFIAPDAILFLTGDRSWVLPHMYDNVTVTEVEGAGYSIVQIPDLSIPMVQTYHPNAYNTRVPNGEARSKAVEYLKSQLGFGKT